MKIFDKRKHSVKDNIVYLLSVTEIFKSAPAIFLALFRENSLVLYTEKARFISLIVSVSSNCFMNNR